MKTEKDVVSKTGRHVANPDKWVENYADYLYRYAYSRISHPEKARDLVQDTFLSALENVAGFEGRSAESTWLTAILKNKIVDWYRKQSTQMARNTTPLEEVTDTDFFDPANGHWTAQYRPMPFSVDSDPVSAKDFARILNNCMKKLPALWFSVFSLKHLEDESSEQICTSLKISPANFWVIMHRSKLNLRACLQKNGF